jgi:hypothetical protein
MRRTYRHQGRRCAWGAPWRPSPSIWQNLIFGTHRGQSWTLFHKICDCAAQRSRRRDAGNANDRNLWLLSACAMPAAAFNFRGKIASIAKALINSSVFIAISKGVLIACSMRAETPQRKQLYVPVPFPLRCACGDGLKVSAACRPDYLRAKTRAVRPIGQIQAGTVRTQRKFDDCEPQPAPRRTFVPSAKKAIGNQGKFFFWNSRTLVLYWNDRVL